MNFDSTASLKEPHLSALERLLRRDRWLVIAALVTVTLLAWGYMFMGGGMSMGAQVAWSPAYAMLVLVMWWLMMVAMMLPSAAPAVLPFANVSRRQKVLERYFVSTAFFLTGYLII